MKNSRLMGICKRFIVDQISCEFLFLEMMRCLWKKQWWYLRGNSSRTGEAKSLQSTDPRSIEHITKKAKSDQKWKFCLMDGKINFFQLYILCMSSNCIRGELPVWNTPSVQDPKFLLGIVCKFNPIINFINKNSYDNFWDGRLYFGSIAE